MWCSEVVLYVKSLGGSREEWDEEGVKSGLRGRGGRVRYGAAWVWCLGVLFLIEEPFSAVMPRIRIRTK